MKPQVTIFTVPLYISSNIGTSDQYFQQWAPSTRTAFLFHSDSFCATRLKRHLPLPCRFLKPISTNETWSAMYYIARKFPISTKNPETLFRKKVQQKSKFDCQCWKSHSAYRKCWQDYSFSFYTFFKNPENEEGNLTCVHFIIAACDRIWKLLCKQNSVYRKKFVKLSPDDDSSIVMCSGNDVSFFLWIVFLSH